MSKSCEGFHVGDIVIVECFEKSPLASSVFIEVAYDAAFRAMV